MGGVIGWRFAVTVLLSSLAGACSCNGIDSFPDRPVGMGFKSKPASVWINGSVFSTLQADPVEVSGIKVWVNYDVSAIYSGQRLARVEVQNSQGATRVIPGTIINYNNEHGFKSTGPVELSPYLTRGVNIITFYVTNGVTGSLRLRGKINAQGSPAGSTMQCFESDQAPAQQSLPFKVYYKPDRARTS